MSEPRLTDQAEADLEKAWEDFAEHNEAAADRLIDDIMARARLHAKFPLMGRPRDDLQAGLRSFVVSRYVIFYQPEADSITVLRVLHGRRDIDSIIKGQE